jgi:hypothetical protein
MLEAIVAGIIVVVVSKLIKLAEDRLRRHLDKKNAENNNTPA